MNHDFWVKKLKLRQKCKKSLNLKADEKIIFVADVHLSSTNQKKNDFFAEFLKTLDSSVKAVFIIGDFFDFYIDSPQENEEVYASVFAQTKRLKQNGTMLHFLPGNRDFFLFNQLQDFGIERLPLWVKLDVNSGDELCRILLTHGDNLMINLHRYRFYCAMIRSSISYGILKSIGYRNRLRVANLLRKTLSAKYKPMHPLDKCFPDFSFSRNDYVKAFQYPIKNGLADVMILGHWHLRANIDMESGRIYVVGDWRDDEGAFIEYSNGHFFHKVFT
ncbi:MAG: metallophosphoesterase [Planctomycetes bacterium]|nr:metallophosphoesterase [Planctomycetota bacterium]